MKSKKAVQEYVHHELLDVVLLKKQTWDLPVSFLSSSELERFSIALADWTLEHAPGSFILFHLIIMALIICESYSFACVR